MSGRMKWKTLVLLCVQMICIVALAVFLVMIQNRLAMNSQQQELLKKLEEINEQIDVAIDTFMQLEEIFDCIYQDKAESLAYMVQEQVDPSLTQSVMEGYCDLLDVDNVLVLDREGNILAQAQSTPAKFERSRYNMLRTVFSDHQPSQSFRVQTDGVSRLYYGAWIDGQRMAVVEVNAEEIDYLLADTVSWQGTLENVSVGLHGYAFVISTPDYRFYYHPDFNLINQDALAVGLQAEDLQDGNITWFELNGERFYGGVTQPWNNLYVVCAISEEEINSERNVAVGIVLFVFIAVSTAVIAYAIALHNENEKADLKSDSYWHNGKIRIHRRTGAKIAFVSVLGLICILYVSMFMQTLYSLSSLSVAFAKRFVEVENDVVRQTSDLEKLTDNYNRAYLSKAQTAAYILEKKTELINRSDLTTLSDVLDVEYTFVFDSNGVMTATDSPYSHFSLSQNKEDQSYEFNELLRGVPYLIQEARYDDVEHIYRQYVGVTLRDEAGEADGFVQIAVSPELLEDAVSSIDIGAVLRNIEIGTNGFCFAVDNETKDFIWHPDNRKIGKNALDYGISEDAFVSGVSEYITMDNGMYYTTVEEIDDNYIFLAIPQSEIGGQRLKIAIVTTLFSLVALGLIGIMAVVESDSPNPMPVWRRKVILPRHGREHMGDVLVEDKTKKTESAFLRWCNVVTRWGERTPEQKVMFVVKGMMFVLAAFVCLAVANKEQFFSNTSVILYIISGTWKRGFNIFSVTACITTIIVIFAGTVLIRSILRLLARCLDARKETIIRLISNLLEYAALIGTIYYCLALFGVNTSALLASAGVLSLVIGLGAQSLVTDILAGLFIVFEGEFRVGDIITIDDWRGTVVEIGVRTTKVENTARNIKVFNNSTISSVINMTQKESGAMCEVAIDLNENLERVEKILKEEFPNMRKRLEPMIVDGPFYSGVSELSDRGVVLRIIAICSEVNRKRLTRKLNREIKLVFDQNNIKLAFPQMVIHETSERQEAYTDPKPDGESELPPELESGLEKDIE